MIRTSQNKVDCFEKLLFSCCESSLQQYSVQARYEFYLSLLEYKNELLELYTVFVSTDTSAESYEEILELTKNKLQCNMEGAHKAPSDIAPMLNHTVYGLARNALQCAYS
ncbi:hypothetical protein J8L98_17895 [Pseudoalteromonas sp. MMG013]|uniref:hypothetical protein n=1 Tax=Pseudoalteromonas sp. MMG013 TaxID=2822687 RepID=UPI001B360291|nr:hypothetical protein [Pseudoalteromonas sp. MMG013]MBQ4863558.1 hypothetical protein [Pseudoalteromonas sp. MMG013]